MGVEDSRLSRGAEGVCVCVCGKGMTRKLFADKHFSRMIMPALLSLLHAHCFFFLPFSPSHRQIPSFYSTFKSSSSSSIHPSLPPSPSFPAITPPDPHTALPAAVQRSPPRPRSSCQVTGTEAVTSPPPRPTVSLSPLPWQRRQRPAEPRLATRRLQEKRQEKGKRLENA